MTNIAELGLSALIFALNASATGGVLLISTAAAFRLVRGVNPRMRYWAVVTAFLAAIIIPALTTFEIWQARTAAVITVSESIDPAIAYSARFEKTEAAPNMWDQNARQSITKQPPIMSVPPFQASPLFLAIFVTVWIIGALLLLARELAGHIILSKARRVWAPGGAEIRHELSISDHTQLYISDDEGPFAVGV